MLTAETFTMVRTVRCQDPTAISEILIAALRITNYKDYSRTVVEKVTDR